MSVRLLNGYQNHGSCGDLVPVHEVGKADGGQGTDLVAAVFCGDVAGGLELEECRHAIAAEAPEQSLPEAQDSAVAPAEHQADSHECIAEVLGHLVQAECVQRQREDRTAGPRPGSARPERSLRLAAQ